MTSIYHSRSLAELTADDSKILGNLKPRLRKLEEQYNIQSNKFKVVNSSWTPLVNKSANTSFDLWNDKQRKWFLLNLFSRLRPPQICYLEELFESFGMYERRDFTRVLPTNLTERIFRFLSPQDLSRCAQVSSHWKTLSERDDVWKPKCLKLGWYLPYEPVHREVGAWKAHYVECVCSIHALPLSKSEAFKYRNILYHRELTDAEKEKHIYFQTKRNLAEWNFENQVSIKQPWQPNSNVPKDLKKSDKLLYSYSTNFNHPNGHKNPLDSVYRTQLGLPIDSRLSRPSKSVTGYMLDDLRKSLPLHVLNLKESYKSMRKSETDFFSTKLSSASLKSFRNQSTQDLSKITTNSFGCSLDQHQLAFVTENPYVIFISSKVPCCHLLLESLRVNAVAIPYDFESTNINTLTHLMESALNGRQAKSIGLFLHFDKPGQIALTGDKNLYNINMNNKETSNFLMQLKNNLNLESNQATLDIFVPLGSSVEGLELIDKIQKFIGVDVRVPSGFLGNYKFITSKWINALEFENQNPATEYFVEPKLEVWLNYCDTLQDAHDKISEKVIAAYNYANNEFILKRIVGKIIFDSLERTRFLTDQKTQRQLANLITKAGHENSDNFFPALLNELMDFKPVEETDLAAAGDLMSIDQLKNSTEFTGTDLMRSDLALKSLLRHKSRTESVEPGQRVLIALEIAKSEINYLKKLEVIQKYYARPVKASLNAGKKIISQSIINLLFNDLAIIYNISKDIVREFNLRIKNWQVDCCISDVLNHLSSSLQAYINYANNYDSIIATIDKLMQSNPKFRSFLGNADRASGFIPLQDLMQAPWQRLKDYMNLLSSLELHTPNNHPDRANITNNGRRIREVHAFVKSLQNRLNNKHQMLEIQQSILNAPTILKDGRYLILRQNALLLNKLTYAFVKDLTLFLFNDSILLTFRVRKHFPFTKFTEETLVYYELVEDLINLTLADVSDFQHAQNVVHLQFNKYDDFYIAFDTYEIKYNFLKSLKLASELSVTNS